MPKPQMNTPVSYVISLLAALPEWHKEHAAALKDGLDAKFKPGAIKQNHDALDQKQEIFEREQKEDVAATIEVDDCILRAAALLGSISKTAQAALREHPQRQRLTRQIIEDAPSTIRTANTMTNALKLASAGLKQHAELFKSREALHTRLVLRADALIVELGEDHEQRKTEQVESRAASAARDLALKQALALITALDDGAQAVYFEDPAPYNTLRVLYDIHCPTPPQVVHTDEDDMTQPGNDPSHPADPAD